MINILNEIESVLAEQTEIPTNLWKGSVRISKTGWKLDENSPPIRRQCFFCLHQWEGGVKFTNQWVESIEESPPKSRDDVRVSTNGWEVYENSPLVGGQNF